MIINLVRFAEDRFHPPDSLFHINWQIRIKNQVFLLVYYRKSSFEGFCKGRTLTFLGREEGVESREGTGEIANLPEHEPMV